MRLRAAVTVAFVVPAVALAGCWPFSSDSNKQAAPTPPATATAAPPAASPTAASGLGGDYCSIVIKVNTDTGTMVNKKFVPTDQWTHAQVQTLVDFVLSHTAEFRDITPPELKSDIDVEILYWQAVKDAGYNMTAAKPPAGIGEAAVRITKYQQTHCGIS
jgi:hypothetical protein